jgi:hypothetical protein
MKILIDNRTDLNNEEIGIIIDDLQEREKGSAQYYGKWKGYELKYEEKKLKIETLVMKRYFKVLIMEVNNGKND